MDNELQRMLKKVAVASSDALFRQFSVQTKKKYKNFLNTLFPHLDLKLVFPEYEADASSI